MFLAPNTPGQAGSVSNSVVDSRALDSASKQTYPAELLVIMRRQAEDLLLSNSDSEKGREAFEFILSVANEISGDEKVERIKKCELGYFYLFIYFYLSLFCHTQATLQSIK